MIYFKTLSVVEFLIVGLFVVVKVDMLKYLDFGISLQLARIYLRLWRLIAFIKDLVLFPMYCSQSMSIMIIRLNRTAYLMFIGAPLCLGGSISDNKDNESIRLIGFILFP